MASISETLRSSTAFDIEIPNPPVALLLNRASLWPGIMVSVYDLDKDKVLEDQNGNPLIVASQIGGTETITPGFYRYKWADPTLGSLGLVDTGEEVSFDGDNVVFMLVEAYGPSFAPNDGKYAVYVDNKPAKYKGEFGESVYVKRGEGNAVSFVNYPKDMTRDSYVIPPSAVFIRIRDVYRESTQRFLQTPVSRTSQKRP